MFPFWLLVGVSFCNLNTGGKKPFLSAFPFWYEYLYHLFCYLSSVLPLQCVHALSSSTHEVTASWPVCKQTYFYTYMYLFYIHLCINVFQQEQFTELPPLLGSWHRGQPACPWAEVSATLEGSSCRTSVAGSGNCTLSYNCREETDLKPLVGVLLPTLFFSPGLPCLCEE